MVTSDWQQWARTSLDGMGRGAQARLAKALKCRTGQLAELLHLKSAKHSYLVPLVERGLLAMGAPPFTHNGTRDSATISYLIEHANDEQRAYLLDAANMLVNASSSQAAELLRAMLKTFRTVTPTVADSDSDVKEPQERTKTSTPVRVRHQGK